ncbi:MAG: acyl-CoA dehydrogenase family protein, partial [Flavobacteriales bacterium]|nr:acyl-CoA dehydrogenase family protein [Flavobacteriales bacterium]
SLRTTAVRDGDHYVLNGTKRFITNAPEASIFTVMARTDQTKKGAGAISAFIVEAGTPGLSLGKIDKKMGQKGAHTCDVIFDNCRVPAENIIGGKEGVGFKTAMKVLDKGRINIAAISVGVAERMLEDALRYACERKQFGKPIAEFQAIAFKLADMATRIEAAELLTQLAGDLKDRHQPMTTQGAMAKYYASEVATWASNEAVQIFGGYGYTKDFPVEKFYRDSKLCTIGEGTSEIQKVVISRNVLRE